MFSWESAAGILLPTGQLMGHQRVGALPDTEPWRKVVAYIADGEDVAAVAAATIRAAAAGLSLAREDPGCAYCVQLLDAVVQAARQDDFARALRDSGLDVPERADVFDVTAAFAEAADGYLRSCRLRTDPGEMAQLAALETLAALLGGRSDNLFGASVDEVARAARTLSTRAGFGTLAHDFLARFTRRFLVYHLSRELPLHVGGNGRFADPAEHNEFLDRLEVHCREAAAIARDFAADWYSKAHSPAGAGVTPKTTRGFFAKALSKLRDELRIRGRRRGK
jgi:hypothetical protein